MEDVIELYESILFEGFNIVILEIVIEKFYFRFSSIEFIVMFLMIILDIWKCFRICDNIFIIYFEVLWMRMFCIIGGENKCGLLVDIWYGFKLKKRCYK